MNTSAIASVVTAVDPNSFKLDLDPEFFFPIRIRIQEIKKIVLLLTKNCFFEKIMF